MRFTTILALGTAALAGLSGAVSAQDDVGQAVSMDTVRTITALPNALVRSELTAEQRTALYPRRGPQPGIYRMRVLHSGNCLLIQTGYWPDEQDRLTQYSCPEVRGRLEENSNLYALIPHPAGGYTVRIFRAIRFNGRTAVPGQISNCLTVAPGVIAGPARIEARGCEVPSGAGWTGAGNDDQRFDVVKVAADAWEFRFSASNPESPDCIAARGASREINSDFIKWGCNSNADQRFMLEWTLPLPADLEADTLARSKWFPFADGHHRLSPAQGVELAGASYATFETINDGGDYCMKRCAELGECKAWSWTAAGYAGSLKPMCQWKHDPGTATNRGPASFGKLISGIVRM
ncbi:MAG: hypothetical protein HOO94_02315 [Novosphingobium sp.]|nr:hypothetical protein [Novosphingobium sp.]